MAGAVVGGALLSGFINIVSNKSLREDVVNRVLGKKLGPGLVERLKISLHAAEAVLDDAEYKQLGDERVRDWLNYLRDAVYDADDFLDAVLTKAATKKEVRSFSLSFFRNRHRKMVDNMEEVVARIEFLVRQKDILGLQKSTKDNNLSSSSSSSSWRETTCLMEGNIYGREDEQQALIKTINDKSESQLSVIPIVGMGGVGKTTLAKWAYSVAEGFDLKAWVCISETFDVADITKKTIEEITKNSCTLGSLNLLQNKLQEILSGKKFFFVLDDVWSEDADKWKQFITPFHCGAKGSTILLTTRNQEVASVVQTCPSCTLNELSEESCWLLFAANACFPELNGNPTLEDVGRKIVKRCKGLPLAVETLGRFLRGKDDVKEWNVVLMNDIWELKNSKIIPALLISYFQLPPYLKRCLLYCSLFPKDHYFKKNELVLLWMAEDLLRLPKRGESLEVVGSQCFEELASRLFFKQEWGWHKMHDLLHDLAIFLAGDFYCRIQELGEQEKEKVLTRHLSHLPYRSLDHPISKVFKSDMKSESLRTSLYIDDLLSMKSGASKLKYLRVLSFRGLGSLPDSIGKLIHLRYLNLSRTYVKTLPESLCNLYNLQTLILYKCYMLTMLPNDMHKLVNLRHLDLRGTCLKEMPRGISKLKMPILEYFVVGKHKDNGIQELGGLSNLEGSFEIKKLENVADIRQARSARMLEKNNIDKLLLEWSSGNMMVSNIETLRDILDNLQPHNGLKELKIKGYKGERFPNWVGHYSYNNMTSVILASCKNCCMLASLGQLPSLKSLRIYGFLQLKRIGDEFYKNESYHHSSPIAPFPSLEELVFHYMPCWEEWHVPDPEAFPRLRRLEIEDCPMLKGDMLNGILWRRDCCLREDDEGRSDEMVGGGDALSIRPSQSFNARNNCLPKSLQKLKISRCPKFEFSEQQQHKYDLVELQIHDSCDSLTSLSLDVFPNLKNLKIYNCRNLESVTMSEAPHAALEEVTINDCSKLVSFAGEGLAAPNLTHLQVTCCGNLKAFAGEGLAAPNLTHLNVSSCSKLEALPRDMKGLLPTLQSLEIYGCPNMCWFAEGGLPPNLKELEVGICEQQMRDLSWMSNLHALTHLTINGCKNIKSYPEVGSLPHLPSLTTLEIFGFNNLETLECNELLRLTSLQQLHIHWCPKLENMEGEKLPPSLLLLKMEYCGLLGEHCKNKHQLIWPKISNIPTIQVDLEQIF
ncbi:putative disease resistance RPP13-like protein 1 [Arachis hypogaea]|uniref:putative disease resistance RPP13-like protein 1 n=1 Tax=Arachis hypogaea TaxID=3818 RepID=UPI000DEC23AE|nr:putative disease resistance RPP13-like protein 1 [Arachis hypogaea]QHO22264.1 Putative disease resistance RPP13-like protein [Arachis hypogaea]